MLSRSSTWSVQATVTKIPQAGWLTKNYFLQFWGLEVQGHGTADLVSGESPQPRQLSSLCPLVVEGVEGPLRGLRPKALVPLVWAPPSWPYHLPRLLLLIRHLGSQDFNLWVWGTQTFRPQQAPLVEKIVFSIDLPLLRCQESVDSICVSPFLVSLFSSTDVFSLPPSKHTVSINEALY